jgi:uncharacterized protein
MPSAKDHAIFSGMSRWGIVTAAYALLAAAAACAGEFWRGYSVVTLSNPWLPLSGPFASHMFSAVLGLCVGALVVISTKFLVLRFAFAARLHAELRPTALELSTQMVVALATASSVGEELVFRGLLLPWIGLVPQSLLFGFLHQTSGSSRWVWMIWATIMGLVLGAMYQLSGSVVGPVIAHAIINGLNLEFLKHHDPSPERRPLGGLLGQRS